MTYLVCLFPDNDMQVAVTVEGNQIVKILIDIFNLFKRQMTCMHYSTHILTV